MYVCLHIKGRFVTRPRLPRNTLHHSRPTPTLFLFFWSAPPVIASKDKRFITDSLAFIAF